MRAKSKKKNTTKVETTAKARELVRAIFAEDFRQKVSKKTIDEVAAEISEVLSKKVA